MPGPTTTPEHRPTGTPTPAHASALTRRLFDRRAFLQVASLSVGALVACAAPVGLAPTPSVGSSETADPTVAASVPATASPRPSTAAQATVDASPSATGAEAVATVAPSPTLDPPTPTSRSGIQLPDLSQPTRFLRRWRVNRVESPDRTVVDLATWRLTVDGLVDKPLVLTYDELLKQPLFAQESDLHCVEGWGFAGIAWEGVKLTTLFDAVGVKAEATHVSFFTFPGIYSDSLSLEQARADDVMIAYRANGADLEEEHGYPLRLVVPQMYGYKSVKWLDRLELANAPHIGYWQQRGWPVDAYIR